jgi:Predicted GTPase
MSVDYKSIEFRLHELLVQIQEMLGFLNADGSLLDTVADCKERIKSKRYRVAVMGEFKKGKSSLINALLGANILPADVTPTTATINRITYGTVPKAEIRYKDGHREEIELSALGGYVTKLTPDGEARALQIDEAVIYSPTVICQNHVDIIDTPGLNDDERMTKITINMLQNVDGVVVAISARTPFSDTEARFVCQLIKSSAIHTIVFTVTFLDQLDEEDYSYENLLGSIRERIRDKVLEQLEKDGADEKILNKAHGILDDMHLFGISAKLAIKSFVTGSSKMLKESRFEEFKTGLLSIITSKQVENAAVKAVDAVHSVLEQLDGQYQSGMRRISGELEDFQNRSAPVYQYCNSCKRAVNDLFMYTDGGFSETLSQIYSLKNILVTRFIKRLSAIKVNTHEEIKSTIAAETLECFEFVNSEFRPPIQSALCENLQSGSRDFAKLRATALLSNLAEQDSDRAQFIGNMLAFSGSILENIRFSWQVPTVPSAADLSKCNVIDTIIHAVDVSVNQYYNTLDNGITQIRKHWFEQVSAEAESAAAVVRQKEDELKIQVETSLKTYESNYRVMSQNAKVIAEKSDSILKEFYRDSASA